MKSYNFFLILIFLNLKVLFSYAQQWGDYTLYSVQGGTTAFLINNTGPTYHSWSFNTSAKTGYSTYLLPGGTILRTIAKTSNQLSGPAMCGQVQKVDWNGNVIWDYTYSSSTYCTHHDVCPMPNGNVLLISYDVKTAAQATQAGCSQNIVIWSEKIIEVQPTGTTTGNIVWEWKAWDHLVQNYNSAKDNYQSSIVNHPELININYLTQKDWMHMNGIDYNPVLDQIVVSSHNLNELYVIDHSTTTAQAATHTGGNAGKGGDILFRWGNPAAYGASGTKIFNVVHNAHWIPQEISTGNNIVAFNNNGVSISKSSVDRIDVLHNGYNYPITLGSAFLPSSYTTRHQCNGHSNDMSSSQQLPNGNQFVCIAQSGYIYEINSAGTSIWSKSISGVIPNSYKYSQCYVDGNTPPTPTITQVDDSLFSSLASTYQWYYNGEIIVGATSQSYKPTIDGIYLVRTTDANNCFFAFSQGYNTSPTSNTLNSTEELFNIFPNPTTGILNIYPSSNNITTFEVKIFNLIGKLVYTGSTNNIDLSNFSKGIYIVNVTNDTVGSVTKKIILNN